MGDKINIASLPLQPLQPNSSQQLRKEIQEPKQAFADILATKLDGGLKFSAHALQRMKERNLQVSPEGLEKLNTAVTKAAQKGSRESLVLMQNMAFVVSVKNNTVITAVDGNNLKENVFTNIDSAIVI